LTTLFNLSTAERKRLAIEGFYSVYDFYSLETKGSIQELISDEKARNIAITIQSALNCPISFIDDFPSVAIPKFLNAGIRTAKEFLIVSDDLHFLMQALGEVFGLIEHVRRYPSLKKAINIINIPITAFSGLSDLHSSLNERKIQTLGDLLASHEVMDSNPEIIKMLSEITPADLKRQMDLPIALPNLLPPEIFSALRKRKISNLYQLAIISPSDKKEIEAEVQKNHPQVIFPEINFARVIKAFNLPVCFVPGFAPADYRKLAEGDLRTIGSLFSKDPKVIARLLPQKADSVRNALAKVTVESIEISKSHIGTPLEDLSLFTEEEIQKLSENAFTLFEDVYFGDRKKLLSLISNDQLKRFFWIANAPSFYIEEISMENIPIIREYMRRIVDFLLLPDALLTALLGDNWNDMKKKRFQPKFSRFEARRAHYPSLENHTQINKDLLTKLAGLNIENLVDLAFLEEEIASELSPPERKEIRRLQTHMESKITLVAGLTEDEVSKLKAAGVGTVLKWLYWDTAQLSKITGKETSEIDRLRTEFNIEHIKQVLKEKKSRKRSSQAKKSAKGTRPKTSRQGSLNTFKQGGRKK
ncbi:MAG: hypothetical protein ACFFB3_14185, partial [Candidatus Hodarchaeota archaeon]